MNGGDFVIKIVEIKNNGRTIYNVTTYADNKIIDEKNICYQIYVGNYMDRKVYIMYDSEMKIVEGIWEYINFIKDNRADNSKMALLFNLKYIYIYCDIFKKNIAALTKEDAIAFAYFIAGINHMNTAVELDITRRTQNTALKIFQNTKDYLDSAGYRKSFQSFSKCPRIKNVMYESKAETNQFNDKKYITDEEYSQIIEYINKDTSIDNLIQRAYKLIIKLMYESGLRCGECLGLTLEDYSVISNKKGKLGLLIIRNRTTDSLRQHAKTCSKINSKATYHDKSYGQLNVDYQISFMSMNTFNELEDYIYTAHEQASSKKNYCKSLADSIQDNSFENHYIFLNSQQPTPLSYETFNRYLKKVFKALDIPSTDYTKQIYAHRFRHGFVINKLYHDNLSETEAIELTRHATINGLLPYKSLSIKDLSELYVELEEYLEHE